MAAATTATVAGVVIKDFALWINGLASIRENVALAAARAARPGLAVVVDAPLRVAEPKLVPVARHRVSPSVRRVGW